MILLHLYAQNGRTALHCAARNGHHETCGYLIEHGASVNAEDEVSSETNLAGKMLCGNYKFTFQLFFHFTKRNVQELALNPAKNSAYLNRITISPALTVRPVQKNWP